MELKVKEFAQQQGVSDSIIYRHIRNHKTELGSWVVKKSKATWLTEEAQAYLRSLMVQQPLVVNEGGAPYLQEIEELKKKIEQLENRIERKDILIDNLQSREAEKDKRLQEAAENQKLLADSQRKSEELQKELDGFKRVIGNVYVKK